MAAVIKVREGEQKGKPCGDSWIRADFTCHEGETEQQKAKGILFTVRRAAKLQSKTARIRKIAELKSRIKDEAFLGQLIKELGLAHGKADPRDALEKIAKLHSLLESNEESQPSRPKLPYAANLVKDIPSVNEDAIALDIFDRIPESRRTPQTQAVKDAVTEYSGALKAIASLTRKLQSEGVKDQNEYDDLFDQVGEAFDRLKSATAKAQGLPDLKTGNADLDKEINEDLAYIRRTSKESLPGYKIQPPNSLEAIETKSKSDPCPE